MSAVNNIVRLQQAGGRHRKPQNVFLHEETQRMLTCPLVHPFHAKGYVNILLIAVGMPTGLHGTCLSLQIEEFYEPQREKAYRYFGKIGSDYGDCENLNGGVESMKDVPVYQVMEFGINPHDVIAQY